MPVKDYINGLAHDQQRKCFYVFDLVRNFERVPRKFLEKMQGTEDLWEVRVEYESNIFRFLGFFFEGNLLILTHGFTKKSQKTPSHEIELAEYRKADFLSRTKRKT